MNDWNDASQMVRTNIKSHAAIIWDELYNLG